MASVASASPSGQGFFCANSTEDTDSWQYVETNSSPTGYIPSPSSSSFNGWGIIGYPNHLGASPTAMSPLPPPTSHPTQQGTANTTADDTGNQLLSFLDNQEFMARHEFLFSGFLDSTMDMSSSQSGLQAGSLGDIPSFEGMNMQAQPIDLDIPIQFQDDSNVAPWAPIDDLMFLPMANASVSAQMSRTSSQRSVETHSHHSSPGIPCAKSKQAKSTNSIKKVKGGNRVEKRKQAAPRDNFVVLTPNTIHQQSGKPNPFEYGEEARGIHRGRKGPLADKAAVKALNIRRSGACFCCHSRKVSCQEERPCKNCKKIAAQVPQIMCWKFSDFLPVLFPSFIRGHFKKEVMARFISDNVSEFYRPPSASAAEPYLIELSSGARFLSTLTIPASFFAPRSAEVLQHWHMGVGAHQLDLHARAAVPVGVDPADRDQREALRRRAREYVHHLVAEPRYAEQVTDAHRGTALPRLVLAIAQRFALRSQSAMVKRALAVYVTHYTLTRQLCLTPATLARLDHLQQTQPQAVPFLSAANTGAAAGAGGGHAAAATTARILNRQIKAVLDEHLLKETEALFGAFGASLKLRSRAEWAPCLASFLVLCLLFESVEAAADTFVVSEAEIALRTRRRSTFAAGAPDENMVGGGGGFAVGGRRLALDVCREIDNLPFRQVAYRFHAVYQTHHTREPGVGTKAGSGKGGESTFNPLVDQKLDIDLEPAAAEMAASLRGLLDDDDSWHELDFLAADPILSQAEAHPYPRDITLDYTGRLLARFLLSFTDEKYLFDGQY
ncbi:hypothetical protein GGS24DRAFT_463778 [Hypoxylon argillaceum]|nr:hypothetical protein GGS24DRAFT_463778 [Hypoxylon argillaceum]